MVPAFGLKRNTQAIAAQSDSSPCEQMPNVNVRGSAVGHLPVRLNNLPSTAYAIQRLGDDRVAFSMMGTIWKLFGLGQNA